MTDNERNEQPVRRAPRADPSDGLDLDALRRKRDLAVARRPVVGAAQVDLATLWHGRLARYDARRQPSPEPPSPAIAGSSPTALYSLPPSTRLRLWHGNRDELPPERSLVAFETRASRRRG